MQILRDVFLVNGAPYGRHQNGYVVRLGDTYVTIDSGDLDHPTFDPVMAYCAGDDGIALENVMAPGDLRVLASAAIDRIEYRRYTGYINLSS